MRSQSVRPLTSGIVSQLGIIGRTGAGKSSIISALLRLVDLEDGKIEIDGEDIAKLPLQLVRTRISVCPQNPILFSGTVRTNVDPYGQATDAEACEVLASLTRTEDNAGAVLHLGQPIASGGTNVSAGQRQVISLARA